jgi:arylsulfatase
VRIDDYKYRFTDQPNGWLGATVMLDMPVITNLRLDPFERSGMPAGANGSLNYYQFFVHEFWRFVLVQQQVAQLGQSLIAYPPMQRGASFNLDQVKAAILKAIKSEGD